jgi:hypothetical protein
MNRLDAYTWTDAAQDAVIRDAIAFAASLSSDKDEALARHFWPEMLLAFPGANLEALHACVQRARAVRRDGPVRHDARTVGGPSEPEQQPVMDKKRACGYTFNPVDFATFVSTDYRINWLIQGLLARGQLCILGGPKKVLKTSIALDLTISLSSGAAFLGKFPTCGRVRACLISGESGEPTLKGTALRICAVKGVNAQIVDAALDFKLPELANPEHLDVLSEGIRSHGIDVLIIDPLYLALLSGPHASGLSASSIYDMGPLLANVSAACLSVGCTPILIHHARMHADRAHRQPELADLAFAGVQEYARQWLLLGRRKKYNPGTGQHSLWLSAGGSAGHGGLWDVDIDEGIPAEDGSGRIWDVRVATASEELQRAPDSKEDTKRLNQARKDKADEDQVLNAIDKLGKGVEAAVYTKVRAEARFSGDRMTRVIGRLKAKQLIEEVELESGRGRGRKAKRSARGLRRRVTGLTGQSTFSADSPASD